MTDSSSRTAVEDDLIHYSRYGFDLGRTANDQLADGLGVHPTDCRALSLIYASELEGRLLTARDLRESLNLTSGAITHSVNRLVKADLVQRDRDQSDRRTIPLRTTPTGAEAVHEFFETIQNLYRDAFRKFSDEDLEIHRKVSREVFMTFKRFVEEGSDREVGSLTPDR